MKLGQKEGSIQDIILKTLRADKVHQIKVSKQKVRLSLCAEPFFQENFKFKKITFDGLGDNNPLVLEEIFKACYRNPDRLKFRNYLKDKDWGDHLNLDTDSRSWSD